MLREWLSQAKHISGGAWWTQVEIYFSLREEHQSTGPFVNNNIWCSSSGYLPKDHIIFWSHWVAFYMPNSILLILFSAENNQFVSITQLVPEIIWPKDSLIFHQNLLSS